MRWRTLRYGIFAALLLSACGQSGRPGTSAVSITISSGRVLHATALHAPRVSAAAAIIVSGADMATMTTQVPVSPGQAASVTLDVPNGTARKFLVNVLDDAGTTLYSGSTTTDLTGTPKTLTVTLQPVTFLGTRQFGTATYDSAWAVAEDGTGNLYVVGSTDGDLDGETNAGLSDIFLIKYDQYGIRKWTRLLGSAADEFGYGVTADASGNVTVFGTTTGGVDGNTLSGASSIDCVVARYDTDGNKQWTTQFGTAGGDCEATGIVTTAAGTVYLAGFTDGNLGGKTNAGGYDAFLAAYDANGTQLWIALAGSSADDFGSAIALGSGGNLYVAGSTYGSLGAAQNQDLSGMTSDLFLMKFTSAGAPVWTKQLGTAYDDDAWAIAADGSGNLYVAGGTYGDLDGNTNANPAIADPAWTATADLFVVKYDSAGTKQWTEQLGTAATDVATAVAVGANGNVYVAGETAGNLDGNVNADATGNTSDLFVVKYDPTGQKLWTTEAGSLVDDSAAALVSAAGGGVYAVGETYGNLDGNVNAGPTGTNDGFLMLFDASGAIR